MNLSANAHLRTDDEIRVDIVPAHDAKTDSYLRIHLGGSLVVFPSDEQAVEIAQAISAAVEEKYAAKVAEANQQLADALASCTGSRSVRVTDRGITVTSR